MMCGIGSVKLPSLLFYFQGLDCCSDYAITFHYVPPNMMYVFEYLVYHLKPFGISTNLMVPLNQSHSSSSSHDNQASQSQYQKDKSAIDKDSKTASSLMKDDVKESAPMKTKVPVLPEDSDTQKREKTQILQEVKQKS